ncbi:hypothetical protein AYI68_g5157 [Smittium mucronatum]|uniref:Phosphatidate phosphatase APP1 catalytic domain-containing protein n=1 Tax=Smittium mucronatum TaxID=133383 RepID=A0A1R0GV32_9FUNG|nr:hypothetical protein AYI68_g5157 [Smittium mucronatum]
MILTPRRYERFFFSGSNWNRDFTHQKHSFTSSYPLSKNSSMKPEITEDLWLFPTFGFRATLKTIISVKKDTFHEENFKKRTDYLLCKPVDKTRVGIRFEKYPELEKAIQDLITSFSDTSVNKKTPPKVPEKPSHLKGELLPPKLPPRNSQSPKTSFENPGFDLFDTLYTFEVENGKLQGEILILDEILSIPMLDRVLQNSSIKFLLNGEPLSSPYSLSSLSNPPNDLSDLRDKNIPLEDVKELDLGQEYHKAQLKLISPNGISVISDIDDTIKELNFGHGKKKMIETAFASEPKMVKGMQYAYSSWETNLNFEFHYISNSPMQLFPIISDFLYNFSFPVSSLHLRSFDKSKMFNRVNLVGNMENKQFYIRELLRKFPSRKFVLVGDSGEKDLELYTSIATDNEFKNQITNIFIRDIFSSDPSEATYGSYPMYSDNSLPGSFPSEAQHPVPYPFPMDHHISHDDDVDLITLDDNEFSSLRSDSLTTSVSEDFHKKITPDTSQFPPSNVINKSHYQNHFEEPANDRESFNVSGIKNPYPSRSNTYPTPPASKIHNTNLESSNSFSGISSSNINPISGIDPNQNQPINGNTASISCILDEIKKLYVDETAVDLFKPSNNQYSNRPNSNIPNPPASSNYSSNPGSNEPNINCEPTPINSATRIKSSSSIKSLVGLNSTSSAPNNYTSSNSFSQLNPETIISPTRIDFFIRVLDFSKKMPPGLLRIFVNGTDLVKFKF